MPKSNLASLSVDELLKLQTDIEPRWLREKLKAGAKLEQFAVNKQRRAER